MEESVVGGAKKLGFVGPIASNTLIVTTAPGRSSRDPSGARLLLPVRSHRTSCLVFDACVVVGKYM
eukprot:scaffold1516_cov266-Prasinococcus_capsulatus_cf.AAC.10